MRIICAEDGVRVCQKRSQLFSFLVLLVIRLIIFF